MKALPTSPQYTSEDLWTRYFTVKMLYIHSRSVDNMRKFGVRVSGDPDIDRELINQEITTQLNIDAMFEKHRAGVTIRVLNYNDTATIYRIIHSHLVACAEYLATGINVGDIPLKDLIELDLFAGKVYDKAKCVFSDQEQVSAIATNFQNVQAFNFHNILTRSRSKDDNVGVVVRDGVEIHKVTTVAEPTTFPERGSLKDLFADRLSELQGWRGKV